MSGAAVRARRSIRRPARVRSAGGLSFARRGGARSLLPISSSTSFHPIASGCSGPHDQFRQNPSQTHLVQLSRAPAAESPRQELFRRCNLGPGGTAVLLELRRRLLRTLKTRPERTGIDADSGAFVSESWFNRGFLVLQRIDWRTSALTLERIINYEAVHQIQGWADLRRRLEADRRCYAFFHPALAGRAVNFHRSGVDQRHDRPRAAAARRERARGRSASNRLCDFLLDHQLPGRLARRVVWQLPDQAGRRQSGSRVSDSSRSYVCHAFTRSRISAMAAL